MTDVSQDFLRDWYTREAIREGHHQRNIYSMPWSQRRMARIKKLLKPMIQGARVLDLGCAEGMYTSWIADNGAAEVVGVDLVQIKLDRADQRPNVRYVCASWDDLPEERLGHFDVALASEVLEHALDPEAVMASLRRIADVIVATSPIAEPEPDDPWYIQGHLRAYRLDTFRALFERVDHCEGDGLYAYVVGR